MMLGTAIVAVSLLLLGFTKEIVGVFGISDEQAKKPAIVLAVLAIYVVDFAINAGVCFPLSSALDLSTHV